MSEQRYYSGDLAKLLTLAGEVGDDKTLADLGMLSATYLKSIEGELLDAEEEIRRIVDAAYDMIGADPNAADKAALQLDAAMAWRFHDFAVMLREKSAELAASAERMEMASSRGWNNTLDAEVMAKRA